MSDPQTTMNLEGRWPELFEGLTSQQHHAIVQVFAASWHEGWEPNYEDVKNLVDETTGEITDEEYERRVIELATTRAIETAKEQAAARVDALKDEMAKQTPPPKYPPKVTFYQEKEDTARMRGAFRHTDHKEGDRSLSDFIHRAVMAEVERRERKYNQGREFPDGPIPRGRPLSR